MAKRQRKHEEVEDATLRRPRPGGMLDRLERAQHTQRKLEQEFPLQELSTTVEIPSFDEIRRHTSDPSAEEDWEGELPPLTDEEQETASAEGLTYRDVEETDVDALWDWIRQDQDRGAGFLGVAPATSADLRSRLLLFADQLYALDELGTPIGLLGFNPVTPEYVNLNLFLTVEARGHLAALVPQLMKIGQELHPGKKLCLATPDRMVARLYQPHGFRLTYLLTWEPTLPLPASVDITEKA